MTLKEQFKDIIFEYDYTLISIEQSCNKAEQIADDYALKFFAWASEYTLNVAEGLYILTDDFITEEPYTIEELLQYFKENIYKKTPTK